MKTAAEAVLPFPYPATPANRRGLRNQLMNAVSVSANPVIIDLSACPGLNYRDIDLLLECIAQVAGRETQVLLAAGSRANRLLLDVSRISSVVPVFDSINDALARSQTPAENNPSHPRADVSQEPRSAL